MKTAIAGEDAKVEVSADQKTWKPAGLNTTLSTVLLQGGHVYGTSLYGEFCCLDGETGKRVWTTLEPTSGGTVPKDRWSSAFLVPHRDRVFVFNERGDLILARLTPSSERRAVPRGVLAGVATYPHDASE